MQDVAYLLWTSVEPAVVVQHEDDLLQYYVLELREQLRTRGVKLGENESMSGLGVLHDASNGSGNADTKEARGSGEEGALSDGNLRRQYEVGGLLLAHHRYLVLVVCRMQHASSTCSMLFRCPAMRFSCCSLYLQAIMTSRLCADPVHVHA